LIFILGAKLLGLQSIRAYYHEDPYFQELGSNTSAQGPYVMQDGFLFKGNKLCMSFKGLVSERGPWRVTCWPLWDGQDIGYS